MGFRFRLHRRDLPGKPDIVLPKYKTVILVHGCFWHRHLNCTYAYRPRSRVRFWTQKFSENVDRDRQVNRQLRAKGWRVMTIWECQTRDRKKLARRLKKNVREKGGH